MPNRSLLTTWLLLAATLAIDVVLLSLLQSQGNWATGYLIVAFHALTLGQLSVICIWSALISTPTVWSRTSPILAAVIVSVATSFMTYFPPPTVPVTLFISFLGYYCLHAVVLVAALWLLQRTKYWRERTGTALTWQFSLFHVLGLMTIVAVLLALLRNNAFLLAARWENIANIFFGIAFAIASAVLWSCSWHWFLRLASVIGFAMLLGVVASALFFSNAGSSVFFLSSEIIGFYLVQALVLSLWLGVAPILPPRIGGPRTPRSDYAAAS